MKKIGQEDITKKAYKWIVMHICFHLLPKISKKNSEAPEYILSMTSWEPRFNDLPYALNSILLQTRKPDKIILYFGNDVDAKQLPKKITRYESKGIEIRFVDENLKAHKKYYYAMQEFPESSIITVDDDVIYSPFTVSSLIKTVEMYHHSVVCARRTHKMKFSNDELLPYSEWEWDQKNDEPRFDLMGTGVGGVLYPPHCVHPDAFIKDALCEIALSNDDIWLKGMELLQGTRTKSTDCLWTHPIALEENDAYALFNINVGKNENDRIFERLQEKYPDIFSLIIKELQ